MFLENCIKFYLSKFQKICQSSQKWRLKTWKYEYNFYNAIFNSKKGHDGKTLQCGIVSKLLSSFSKSIFFVYSLLKKSRSILAIAVMLDLFTHIINALLSLVFGDTFPFGDFLPVIALFAVMCWSSFILATWVLKREIAY